MIAGDLERARKAVSRIVGTDCRSVTPGVGDLTTLGMWFGDETDSYWSDRGRRRVSLFQFFVRTSGAWRLESRERVLCTYDDPKPAGGEVRRHLDELVGQRVSRVAVLAPAGDLAIEFGSGRTVRVICVVREGACGGDYYFSDNSVASRESFQVGPRGVVDFGWPHGASDA